MFQKGFCEFVSFHLFAEAMPHKELTEHVRNLPDESYQSGQGYKSISKTLEQHEGQRQQVENVEQRHDITLNRMSLQN